MAGPKLAGLTLPRSPPNCQNHPQAHRSSCPLNDIQVTPQAPPTRHGWSCTPKPSCSVLTWAQTHLPASIAPHPYSSILSCHLIVCLTVTAQWTGLSKACLAFFSLLTQTINVIIHIFQRMERSGILLRATQPAGSRILLESRSEPWSSCSCSHRFPAREQSRGYSHSLLRRSPAPATWRRPKHSLWSRSCFCHK